MSRIVLLHSNGWVDWTLSKWCQKGDCIAILFGGHVPFLLRVVPADEEGHHYELIGECYVDGVMHGEFMRDQASRGVAPEHFVLV
jgi:hypothetical protein